LIYNEEFTRKVVPFLNSSYFSDQIERTVFKEIQGFVSEYQAMPTHEALVINFTEKKNLSEEQVRGAIELLKELDDHKNEPSQIEWLVEQTEKFCQDKAIYNAIMESVTILDDKSGNKSKGEIPKLLSDALGVSFDQNVGHDYTQDYESRYEFYHRTEKRVKFDLDLFDKITKGGLPIKTLNIALAGTGVGKSLYMCHCAAAAISQGHNVLYITLEMAEERIAERIDANLLNITMEELHVIPREDYARKFSALKLKHRVN
jgi:replicative DNA helicase